MSKPLRTLSFFLFLQSPALAPALAQEGDAKPPAPAPTQAVSIHASFDRILAARVRDGLVDYATLRAEDGKALQDYLAAMAVVKVDQLSRAEQFVFHVNLYNAAMIQAVLDCTAKDPKWTPAAAEFAVFKEKRVQLGGTKVSLDHLENEVLRPKWKDARVHVAIVCGARSCPPLLPRAYEAADLDAVLDANMKAFLRDTARNQVGDGKGEVKLSKIFEWFAADFGGEAGVRKLLAKEFGGDFAARKITYLDYSWELNTQPAPKGK